MSQQDNLLYLMPLQKYELSITLKSALLMIITYNTTMQPIAC